MESVLDCKLTKDPKTGLYSLLIKNGRAVIVNETALTYDHAVTLIEDRIYTGGHGDE